MEKCVLVVDDDPLVTKLFQLVLQRNGICSAVANSGKEGLEIFASGSFGLVATDLMMPEMNGYAVLGEIRKLDPLVPVFLVSATPPEDESLRERFTEIIPKPINLQEFLIAVRKHLAAA